MVFYLKIKSVSQLNDLVIKTDPVEKLWTSDGIFKFYEKNLTYNIIILFVLLNVKFQVLLFYVKD